MKEIVASKFKLRPLQASDNEQLAALGNNQKIWLNLRNRFPSPYRLEDADFFIQLMTQPDQKAKVFAIDFENAFIGAIGIHPLDDIYEKTAELGYWLGEPYWGQGIISEAVPLVVNYAFENMDLVKVFAGVFDYNLASMRILEKSGFQKEGILRKAVYKNGKFADEHRFGILK